DSFHHAAIAAQRVDAVIKHVEAGTIKVRRLPARSYRHADAGGNALAQRSRRGLDAGSPAILRVSRTAAVELAKTFDVVERHAGPARLFVLSIYRFNSGEVQQTVEQRRGVAHRKYKPIAIRPDGIVGVKAQKVVPQRVSHWRHRHRRSGMPRVCSLNRIHREGADGVYA